MKQYIVDAFSDHPFGGNQAAVCLPENWPSTERMQAIACENGFSETAFAVGEAGCYGLRWFTPGGEIDLCGHATLAMAYALFRFAEPAASALRFDTQSGRLTVRRTENGLSMDFPAVRGRRIAVTDAMTAAIGMRPLEAWLARDLLLVLEKEQEIRALQPDMEKLRRLPGLLTAVTARGDGANCVSRIFAPKLSVPEDPVTGSAHCMIAPYWAERLGKNKLLAEQASARSGLLHCTVAGDRIILEGQAALYAICEILPDDGDV